MDEKYYQVLRILLIILVIGSLFLSVIMPMLLIGVVLEIIFIFLTSKKIKQIKNEQIIQQKKENNLIRQGYKKVCTGFFVNNEEHKLNILDKVYGFSQIVDCELIEDGTSIL